MSDLARSLAAFHASSGCHAAVWTHPEGAPGPALRASSRVHPPAEPPSAFPTGAELHAARTAEGPVVVAAVPGVPRTWVVVGPCEVPGAPLEAHAAFLVPVVGRYLQAVLEVDHAARELSERYEEINLLYSISDILGRAVTLEETASTILTEVSETVGAERAAILVHDRVTGTLQVVAALGVRAEEAPPIPVDDPQSVAARVFRTLHPTIADADEPGCAAEAAYRAGAMLSVPIVWSTREGGEPLGVVTLSGRRHGQHFTAGDLKLVTAIASQIAAAIQNARLVRASLQQQRLAQEMALAHDLQMRLLPDVEVVQPAAQVAARVVPAESVGGDFYHLFPLGQRRSGVMIGDVSSHGYRAALIMALAMSASAIHARDSLDPGDTLAAVLRSLHEELSSTEMFISGLYAIVDPDAGLLRYANAGHPHAFVVGADGSIERLAATSPPLGMVELAPSALTRPWVAGEDLLLLFTDGVSDARDRQGRRLGEEPVLDVVREARGEPVERILARVFDRLETHTGDVPPRDDLTVVVARS